MNFNYHIYESNIKCPYCNKDCEDYDYAVAQDLETKIEFECEYCEKKFYAKASIVYSTHSNCKLNNEKHDWEQAPNYPTVFNCKNCSEYYVKRNKEEEKKEN